MAVVTQEDEQIVWRDRSSGICPSDVNLSNCPRLVRFDGQIVLEKSSFQTEKYQTICSLKNLFVPFAHQTFARLRRFVRQDDLFVL